MESDFKESAHPKQGELLLRNKWVPAAIFPSYNATVLDSETARSINMVGYQEYDVKKTKIRFQVAYTFFMILKRVMVVSKYF